MKLKRIILAIVGLIAAIIIPFSASRTASAACTRGYADISGRDYAFLCMSDANAYYRAVAKCAINYTSTDIATVYGPKKTETFTSTAICPLSKPQIVGYSFIYPA